MLEKEGATGSGGIIPSGRFAEALNPRMTAAWFELKSNIHMAARKNMNLRWRNADAASSLEPDQPVFYACLGKLLSRMNRPAAALEQFRKAIQIRPDYADGHFVLARELVSQGQTAGANELSFRKSFVLTQTTPPPARPSINCFHDWRITKNGRIRLSASRPDATCLIFMWSLLKEFLRFCKQEKKWWLAPLIVLLLALGLFLVFASSSGIAWALYPLF